MHEVHYWVGVVSRAHVERGVAGGFAQLCHGKAAPLRRMQAGDWLVYYSPRSELRGGSPCQAFTALGRVEREQVYQVELSDDFQPFRRDIAYLPCTAAPIAPLVSVLEFTTATPNWGMRMRSGHFAISRADFHLIAQAMGVVLTAA